MKLRWISLVAMACLSGSSAGFGQRPGASPAVVSAPADIYANFVGTWVGTTRVLHEGADETVPVRVEVTEDANRRHLRFFFTFSSQGQKGFEHVTRVATLDPVKGEMTWVEADNPKAPDALRHTAGLDAFARKGYGVFDASYEYGFGSHHLTGRCRFVLDPEVFGYVWYQSVDGKPFAKYSVTQLTRETEAMEVLGAP